MQEKKRREVNLGDREKIARPQIIAVNTISIRGCRLCPLAPPPGFSDLPTALMQQKKRREVNVGNNRDVHQVSALSQSGGADYAPSHLPPDFQTFLQPWCSRRKGGRSTWVIIEMFIKCQCTVGVRGKNLSATGYICNVLLAQKCQNQCTQLYTSGFYNWQIYEVSWICTLIYFCLQLQLQLQFENRYYGLSFWPRVTMHSRSKKNLFCRHVQFFFCIIFYLSRWFLSFYRVLP